MFKLSFLRGDATVEHSHPPTFKTAVTSSGTRRLVVGVPAGDRAVIQTLARELPEPLYLLYILHTPRGEGEAGRYQSPELNAAELSDFIALFGAFLSGDGRHDFWIYSRESDTTLVWDRHNMLYAYGPLEAFTQALRALGFHEGDPQIPFPHLHHYRKEFDADAAALLSHWNWVYSPLRPEDEQ